MNNTFDFERFAATDEWQAILTRIERLNTAYVSACVMSKSFEEKEYFKGKFEALGEIMELPEQLATEQEQRIQEEARAKATERGSSSADPTKRPNAYGVGRG